MVMMRAQDPIIGFAASGERFVTGPPGGSLRPVTGVEINRNGNANELDTEIARDGRTKCCPLSRFRLQLVVLR